MKVLIAIDYYGGTFYYVVPFVLKINFNDYRLETKKMYLLGYKKKQFFLKQLALKKHI
jgi:hypothetical protein